MIDKYPFNNCWWLNHPTINFFTLLAIEYDKLEIAELHENYNYKEVMQRLFELEPIDLNESWDYNSVQKKEIEQARIEKREKEHKAQEELEIRRHTPGYCCVCGAKNANYVINPYYYDMYGSTTMEWLCPSCEYDAVMDV